MTGGSFKLLSDAFIPRHLRTGTQHESTMRWTCFPHYRPIFRDSHPWVTLTKSRLCVTWWRHEMETFSALLAIFAGNSPVPGELSAQRPVTRSFVIFFDLRLNKRLSKQSWGWWFETLSRPLWCHCNDFCLLSHAMRQTVDLSVIWKATTFMWRHCNVCNTSQVLSAGFTLCRVLLCLSTRRFYPYPIMTSSNGNISALLALFEGSPLVIGGFPSEGASNADIWCPFVVSLQKRLNKHSIDWWFETPWRSFDLVLML